MPVPSQMWRVVWLGWNNATTQESEKGPARPSSPRWAWQCPVQPWAQSSAGCWARQQGMRSGTGWLDALVLPKLQVPCFLKFNENSCELLGRSSPPFQEPAVQVCSLNLECSCKLRVLPWNPTLLSPSSCLLLPFGSGALSLSRKGGRWNE